LMRWNICGLHVKSLKSLWMSKMEGFYLKGTCLIEAIIFSILSIHLFSKTPREPSMQEVWL
jgi:hypothetical protein